MIAAETNNKISGFSAIVERTYKKFGCRCLDGKQERRVRRNQLATNLRQVVCLRSLSSVGLSGLNSFKSLKPRVQNSLDF